MVVESKYSRIIIFKWPSAHIHDPAVNQEKHVSILLQDGLVSRKQNINLKSYLRQLMH